MAALDDARLAERHQAWLAALAAEPHRYDFYQAMRRIASAHPHMPPPGEAQRPVDEPVRLSQSAELDFAPATLHSLQRDRGAPPRLVQRVFGLLGPNGALPLHLTEYARDRTDHHGDPTFQRFLDMLVHRFAMLFYRAWAEAQPAVSLDRPGNKAYFNRLGSLVGIGLPDLQDRDAVPDASKIYFAGRLARQTRDAEGLLSWIRSEFDVAVKIEQWSGHWMALARGERSRLGRRAGARLGQSIVLGSAVWDVQHKFRVTIGPLGLSQYRRFLPGGADLARLQALVRHWVGIELAWDVKLILARPEVPRLEFGSAPSGAAAPATLVAEGTHDAELVAVRSVDTAFGTRIALDFRIAAGPHRGGELTETMPAHPAASSRCAELLKMLAGAPDGKATGADGEATRAVAAGSPSADRAASTAWSSEALRALVGRRCRVAVRHERGQDGVTRAALGARTGLGHTTWLGRYLRPRDADDLRMDVERPSARAPAH